MHSYYLLSKYAELFQWFKEFLGYKDSSPMESVASFKERTSGELHHLEIGMYHSPWPWMSVFWLILIEISKVNP